MRKGQKMTEEQRAKVSKGQRKRYQDPNQREMCRDRQKRLMANKDYKANAVEALKNPESVEKAQKARTEKSVIARRTESFKKTMQNTRVRANWLASIRSAAAKPESREKKRRHMISMRTSEDFIAASRSEAALRKRSEAMKSDWQNPQNRAARSAAIKAAFSNAEILERKREAQKIAFSRPESKAKRSAAAIIENSKRKAKRRLQAVRKLNFLSKDAGEQ